MRLTETIVLPTDPRSAARLLADPAFVREKVVASGATCEQADVTGEVATDPVGAFTVTTRRALPADQIPAHLRGFVGGRIEVRQVEAWEQPDDAGERVGTVLVEVAGAPVRLTARSTLVGHGAGATAVRYDGELHASVPLFGGAIEEATASAIRAALAAEETAARHRLP